MAEADVRLQVATLKANQDDLIRRMKSVEDDLDSRYCTKEMSANQDRRIIALEETIKWVARTILGVVILAVLGTIIVVKKGGI